MPQDGGGAGLHGATRKPGMPMVSEKEVGFSGLHLRAILLVQRPPLVTGQVGRPVFEDCAGQSTRLGELVVVAVSGLWRGMREYQKSRKRPCSKIRAWSGRSMAHPLRPRNTPTRMKFLYVRFVGSSHVVAFCYYCNSSRAFQSRPRHHAPQIPKMGVASAP